MSIGMKERVYIQGGVEMDLDYGGLNEKSFAPER